MENVAHQNNVDQLLEAICANFALGLAGLSRDALLREGLVKASIFRIAVALEKEFEGYEDLISMSFHELGDLIGNRHLNVAAVA